MPSQLTLNPGRVGNLNAAFPQAAFDGRARIAAGTQNVRSSTGVELQVMMPVVNAPFRLSSRLLIHIFRSTTRVHRRIVRNSNAH
jgi:hypothetical protein